MKIINHSSDTISYLVTPSGTTLSGSKVVASGTIGANQTLEFPVQAGEGPIVYVKSITPVDQGYFSAFPKDSNGTVEVSVTPLSVAAQKAGAK
jgi:hypothetical protein